MIDQDHAKRPKPDQFVKRAGSIIAELSVFHSLKAAKECDLWLAEELRQLWIEAYDKGYEDHEHGR